jgi:flagellar basal-body rod protein FlgB
MGPQRKEFAMISRLTDGLEFHSQALVLRAERQRLIAGNIANADTPGYQARDFNFADALRQASAGNTSMPAGDSSRRVGDGLGRSIARDVMRQGDASLSPNADFALPSQTNLDSNTVDMDRERASSADNTVKYEATLRFINSHVRTALDAMKSPNQG